MKVVLGGGCLQIKIMETFLKGREKDITKCEDGFVVTDNYAVMIDGAGTPSPMAFNGKKGGRHIMEVISECIPYLQPDLTHETFLEALNTAITKNYEVNGWYEELEANVNLRPMASVLVFSKTKNQLWFYGDCKALVNGTQYENPKQIDDVMLNARKMVIEGELLKGRSQEELLQHDMGRDYIETLLAYQRLFLHNKTNDLLGFSMIDGFDFLLDRIKVVDLPKGLDQLVMTTDGYSVLKGTFAATEETLMNQLKNDPLSINELKGFKVYTNQFNSFDDRAYLRIKFLQ